MAVNPSSFLRAEDVQIRLGEEGDARLSAIELIINAVSEAMRSIIGRRLHFGTDIVDKLGCDDGRYLFTRTFPVASITSIELVDYMENTVRTYSTDEYVLEDSSAGIIRGYFSNTTPYVKDVAVKQSVGNALPNYLVTYTGGWVTPPQLFEDSSLAAQEQLPSELKEACMLAVVSRYQSRTRDVAISSSSSGANTVNYRTPGALEQSLLPAETVSVCRRYGSFFQS